MAGLRSPLDDEAEEQANEAAAAKLADAVRKKKAKDAAPPKGPSDTETGPADPPPNGGSQVSPQAGTQVGTPPGTQVGRTEDSHQEEQGNESLDFSMRGALADTKDPEQDWIKSGWQAKRYRKAAVAVAIKFKWRGYREQQDLIDAALDAFLPTELVNEARDMARRGEL